MDRGAEAYGFRGQAWTCKRVGAVIRRTFGVTYDPSHIGRLLHRLGYSVQRPIERATPTRSDERDSGLVGAALASAQKKAADERRVIVWVDQSGFYLLPHHIRTWARHGQTPVLRVPLTRDHRSAIAAITADQRLVMQTQTEAYHSTDVVRFLRLLLRKIAGKLLIIWDGAPIHRGQPIKDFLARGRRQADPSGATAWLCA